MIKILMLSEYPANTNDEGAGGIMQATFQLIEGFKKNQDEIDIHILSFTKSFSNFVVKKEKNITLYFVPHKKNFFSEAIFGPIIYIYYLIKIKNKIKPDIIHGQGTVTYILLSLIFGKKNIQTIHGIYKNEHAAIHYKDRTFFMNLKFFIKEKIEGFYLKKIKNLIVITDEIKQLVSAESKNLKNIFKINNAIDIGFFKKKNMGSAPIKNDLVILFVAAITPRKGLHYLLEAFDKIASKHLNVKLKIVGMWDWAPDYVLGLKENFSQHINTKKIEFTGSVSREEIENYFTSSQIFVLPSLAESAPMVISQAMCSGMAIISTKVGGIPEMITHEKDGFLVNPKDVQALESALDKFISSNQLREVFSKNAQIKGYNRYHPTSVAAQTYEAYKKVLLN